VTAGLIDADAARTHPRRNVVTRALGSLPGPEVDLQLLPLIDRDRFVICSDGLTSELTDAEIATEVGSGGELQATADGLVAQALAAGGSDNVTVIVVDVLA
jgi:serine/threonine protein phosphatase PrpC